MPTLPRAVQLIPSLSLNVRDIWTMRTCNVTCTEARTVIWSWSAWPASRKPWATATAWAASAGVSTQPVSSRPLGCARTRICPPGTRRSISVATARAENSEGCTVTS